MTIVNIEEQIIKNNHSQSENLNNNSLELEDKKNYYESTKNLKLSLLFGALGFFGILIIIFVNSNEIVSHLFINKIVLNISLISSFTLFFAISCIFGSKSWELKLQSRESSKIRIKK